MIRKISAAVLILTLVTTLFSCRQAPPEAATQISDGDSVHLRDDIDTMGSQLAEAESATAVSDTDSFSAQLASSEADVISYEGNEDVVIDGKSTSGKTVKVNTKGSVILNSPVGTLIVNGAENGFTAKAEAGSIILEGSGITAEIKSKTGTIIINGKNVTVSVSNSSYEKLIVLNVSAVINNLTADDIPVTLANGTKVTVPAKHVYKASDNTVQKN